MNNKGFAVSTILYGLSIMGFLIVLVLIGLMATNRSNTKDFVQQVEDELNRFSSKQTEITMHEESGQVNPNYPQEYFTLDGGDYWYKIELWGGTNYKSATIKVSQNTIIYFYIGDASNPTIACLDGEARENCKENENKLVMSTAIANGVNPVSQASQGSDVDKDDPENSDTADRIVYLNDPHNVYQYNTINAYKARVSLASMDEEGSYLSSPTDVAGVFYVGPSYDSVYTCSGTCNRSSGTFTGDQDQQWTVVGNTMTNVKFKQCSFTYDPYTMKTRNALF